MAISLRQIEAFLAVAAQGTFTKAAEVLHVAQPALSQLVRDLEQELGVRLLDRTTRRVELTEAGREFRAAASKILDDLDVAIENAGQIAERKRGRIAVAVPPLLAAVLLPSAITALHETYPGLKVNIMEARNEVIVEAVRNGQVDCAVGTFSALEGNIERTSLARDQLMLFCPAGSEFADRSAVRWAELGDQPLIALTRDSGIRLLVDVGFENAQIEPKPAYEVAQITTALALVAAGHGITVLPTYARAVAGGRVVARPLAEPSISRDIVMIRPSGRSLSPAMTAFETVLRRYTRRLVPEDAPEDE